MIFIPVIIFLIQTMVVLAAQYRSPRLDWVTALMFSALSIVGIIFLIPFLPVEFEFGLWQPSDVFHANIHFELSPTLWAMVLMLYILTFSAIVYHPTEMDTGKRLLAHSGLLAAAAVLVFEAANILTLMLTLLVYDAVSIVVFAIIQQKDDGLRIASEGVFARALSILLLLAAMFRNFPGSEGGSLAWLEQLSSWIVLFALLLRVWSIGPLNSEKEEIRGWGLYHLLMDAAVIFSLFANQSVLHNDVISSGFFGVAALVLGVTFSLKLTTDPRFNFKYFILTALGVGSAFMHISSTQNHIIMLTSLVLVITAAGLFIGHSISGKLQRLLCWVLISLVLGFPYTLSATWGIVWGDTIRVGGKWLFLILLPLTLAMLANSFLKLIMPYQVDKPEEELIRRGANHSVPILSISSGWIIGIQSGWGDASIEAWVMGGLTAILAVILHVVRPYVLQAGRVGLPPWLSNFKLNLQNICRPIRALIIQAQLFAEEFLEGDSSFLWILFSLVVLAMLAGG